jgi:hypothetical protein
MKASHIGALLLLQIELARLEMKGKSFDRAVEVLQGAHSLAVDKFGEDTPEACEYPWTMIITICCFA